MTTLRSYKCNFSGLSGRARFFPYFAGMARGIAILLMNLHDFLKNGTRVYLRWSLALRCLICICNSTQICTLWNETKYPCWRAHASDAWQHYDVTAGEHPFTVKTNNITPLSGQMGYFCWGDEFTTSVFKTNFKTHRRLIIASCFKIEFQISNSWNVAKN